jgi:hypothetical protein
MQEAVAVAVLEMKVGLEEAVALVEVVLAHILATVAAAMQIQAVVVVEVAAMRLLEALVVLEL